MKYSVVGHSCIQNVDNMHSNIEKAMRVSEFFSPISFLRILLNGHRVKRYKVIQMDRNDLKVFRSVSKNFASDRIPFSEMTTIKFSRDNLCEVWYKKSHVSQDLIKESILKTRSRRFPREDALLAFPSAPLTTKFVDISQEKKQDLLYLTRFIPVPDATYYNSIL